MLSINVFLLFNLQIYNVVHAISPATLDLGFVFPMFSANFTTSQSSLEILPAFLMALSEINNKSDNIHDAVLPSTTLRVAVRNSRSTFFGTLAAALDLSANVFGGAGVQAGVGSRDTPVTVALQSVYADRDIVHIGYSSGNELTVASAAKTYLGIVPPDRLEGAVIAQLVSSSWLHLHRVVVFYTVDPAGELTYSAFQDEGVAAGIEIKAAYPYVPASTDFAGIISSALAYDPYLVVVLAGSAQDGARLLEQAFDMGLIRDRVTVVGNSYLSSSALWGYMSSAAKATRVLSGYLGVSFREDGWKSTPAGAAFMARYRVFVANLTQGTDGVASCSSAVDDDGGTYLFKDHLHYNATAQYVCAQVNSSYVASSDANIDPLTAYVYDAVQALALGIDAYLVANPQASTLSGREIKALMMGSLSFAGVTGQVSFSQPASISDAGGSRLRGLQYTVLNFQSAGGAPQLVPVGVHDMDSKAFGAGAAAVFNGVTAPVDRAPPVYETVSDSARLGLAVAVALLLVGHVFETIVFVVYRRTSIMKASQPVPMYFIMLGLLFALGYSVLVEFDLDSRICSIGNFFGHLAFNCIFVPLQIKLWRVHFIVNIAGMRKVKITDTFVFTAIGLSIAFVLFLLFVGVGLGNGELRYNVVESMSGVQTYYPYCYDAYSVIDILLYIFEAAGVANAIRLCWETRKAPPFLNDSVHAGSATVSVCIICVILFSIVYSNVYDSVVTRVALSVGFLVASFLFIGLKLGFKTSYIFEELRNKALSGRIDDTDSQKNSSNYNRASLSSSNIANRKQAGVSIDDEEVFFLNEDVLNKVRTYTIDKQLAFAQENAEKYRKLAIKIGAMEMFEAKNRIGSYKPGVVSPTTTVPTKIPA